MGGRAKGAPERLRELPEVRPTNLEPQSSIGEGGKLCHLSHLLRRRDVSKYACRWRGSRDRGWHQERKGLESRRLRPTGRVDLGGDRVNIRGGSLVSHLRL